MIQAMRRALVRIGGLPAALFILVLAMNVPEVLAAAVTAKMVVSARVVRVCNISTAATVVGSGMLDLVDPAAPAPVALHCSSGAAPAVLFSFPNSLGAVPPGWQQVADRALAAAGRVVTHGAPERTVRSLPVSATGASLVLFSYGSAAANPPTPFAVSPNIVIVTATF